ncbi:tyrosine-type recombinase/integrase [Pseudomonas coronafaciens]|uniref:Tyrosine-type recombinase/integrase n=1 Tax=Pseudomonas coronafaciens pv. coronafaciens TaxID=235275 RepID=A0AAE6QHJ7_9PSED|nr:site-specific integrase [Pseudomonas coronafaciens]QGT81577.1 tyrosine-type recombinase/integrase [Pseudomonas coronafaciens pv. coronafaciens]QIQ74459.1 Prophage integrase IntA [Pseudomonas coronafaciens]RMM84462.1 putative Phage integrase [Pseudomonas coronafaciens pv. striafaciens]
MTAAVRITEAEIKRQAAGTERDLRDVENRGLYLRFTRDRARASWYLVSKGKWNLVGRFPDLSAKQVVAALPGIRLRIEAGANSTLSKWATTGELLCWFADRYSLDRSLSEKRKDTSASMLRCHLVPCLGDVALSSIDKATLDSKLIWPMQQTVKIDYVRSAFQLLALAFRQAFKLRLISANPMQDIKFKDFSTAKVGIKASRLRGTQLQDLLHHLAEVIASNPHDGMLAVMMLCHGTRIGETRLARWSHISLAEREWFIPSENTKTGVEHHLPLTDQVRQLLIWYRDKQQATGYDGQFLFPGRGGEGLSEGRASAVFARVGKGEWTSHDLRKLARTCWADIGIDHLIGELLINHAMGHNVKVYVQSGVMARKRDALVKWNAHLDGKGFGLIHELTGFRFEDSDNYLQPTDNVACSEDANTTIGEV